MNVRGMIVTMFAVQTHNQLALQRILFGIALLCRQGSFHDREFTSINGFLHSAMLQDRQNRLKGHERLIIQAEW
jgi:hypothetical protein